MAAAGTQTAFSIVIPGHPVVLMVAFRMGFPHFNYANLGTSSQTDQEACFLNNSISCQYNGL